MRNGMASNNSVTKHLKITGRVQGVSYRYWTQTTAQRMELSGWVRNLSNGSVEAVVKGEPERVEDFIKHCHEGPPLAVVESVDVENIYGDEWFDGFKIKPTV